MINKWVVFAFVFVFVFVFPQSSCAMYSSPDVALHDDEWAGWGKNA